MSDNSRQRSENRSLARRGEAMHPVPAFRRDFERLFEEFLARSACHCAPTGNRRNASGSDGASHGRERDRE